MKDIRPFSVTHGNIPFKQNEDSNKDAYYYEHEYMSLQKIAGKEYAQALLSTIQTEATSNGLITAGQYLKHELSFECEAYELGGYDKLEEAVIRFDLLKLYNSLAAEHDYDLIDILLIKIKSHRGNRNRLV